MSAEIRKGDGDEVPLTHERQRGDDEVLHSYRCCRLLRRPEDLLHVALAPLGKISARGFSV